MVNTKKKVGTKKKGGGLFSPWKKKTGAPRVRVGHSAGVRTRRLARTIKNTGSTVAETAERVGMGASRGVRDGYVSGKRFGKTAGKLLKRNVGTSIDIILRKYYTPLDVEVANTTGEAHKKKYYNDLLGYPYPVDLDLSAKDTNKLMETFHSDYDQYRLDKKKSDEHLTRAKETAVTLLKDLNKYEDNYIQLKRQAKNKELKGEKGTRKLANSDRSTRYTNLKGNRRTRDVRANRRNVISERSNAFESALKNIKPNVKNGKGNKAEYNISLIESARAWIIQNSGEGKGTKMAVRKIGAALDQAIKNLGVALESAQDEADDNGVSLDNNITERLNDIIQDKFDPTEIDLRALAVTPPNSSLNAHASANVHGAMRLVPTTMENAGASTEDGSAAGEEENDEFHELVL